MLPVRTPPAFIPSPALLAPPVVKAAGVGGAVIVGGALAIKTPVLLIAGGAALVGFGIYQAFKFFSQRWGYENGKAPVGAGTLESDGVQIEWTGPGLGRGGKYYIRQEWDIKYREVFDSPDDDPQEYFWTLNGEIEDIEASGIGITVTATADTPGVWQWGFTNQDGERQNFLQWPSSVLGTKHYRVSEGAFKVDITELRAPTFPAANPFPSYTPRTLPEPEPQTLPAPEPKRLPPLPQPLPDIEPLRVPAPEQKPLPLPLPQPSPGTAPNPSLPETFPLPNDGTVPLPAPLPVPVTPPDEHFLGDTPIGSTGPSPDSIAQIAKELGRIEKKTAMLIRPFGPSGGNISEILEALLKALLQLLPGFDYSLTEKCEPCGDEVPCPAPVYSEKLGFGESAGIQGLAYRIDALARLVDAQLGAKQLTCAPKKPELKGQWVTVNFESVTIPADRRSRLYKRFRYRTESNRSLGELSDYWKDFKWSAGAAIVIHKGHSWGTPQCWAADPDEGRRVIGFAAAESGFDPDTVGQWQDSVSRDSRYGRRIEMRVKFVDAFPCVTSREGPSGLPEVARRTVDP